MTETPVAVRRYSRSELNTFRRCKRKWWFQYYLGLKAKDRLVDTASTGILVHKMLQDYYNDELDIETYRESKKQFDYPNIRDEIELACIMAEGYVDWIESEGADSRYEIIQVEAQLNAKLDIVTENTNRPCIVGGTLDLVLWDKVKEVPVLMDHKTVSSFKQTIELLPVNPQFQLYIALHNVNVPETPINYMIVNMLRRVKRSTKANPPFYLREPAYYNDAQLQTIIHKTIAEIATVIENEYILDSDPLDSEPFNDWKKYAVVTPNQTVDCSWDCAYKVPCKMMDDGSRAEGYVEEVYDVKPTNMINLTVKEHNRLPVLRPKQERRFNE